MRILFGAPDDPTGRRRRRRALVAHLRAHGYEPVPATMAPPYRGLAVDTAQPPRTDEDGLSWRDYVITEPQPMSRVFGPLGRYKLYERLDDNADWAIDFSRPRHRVWDYVCRRYAEMQQRYGFDFMRGDMSHVQMRPHGPPSDIDPHYDILRAVKRRIADDGAPHFAYLAESFLAAKNVMGYGDEIDHLEASDADLALGNLQAMPVGSSELVQTFRRYLDLAQTRRVTPCFTVMTADKDDPRFDDLYLTGSAVRLFVALFQTDLPSYMALGFECRDLHHEPAPNEAYTKLFVFHETDGPKARGERYRWGRNGALFETVTELRRYRDRVADVIEGRATRWLIHPDATAESGTIAWTQDPDPGLVCLANAQTDAPDRGLSLPLIGSAPSLTLELSTTRRVPLADRTLISNGRHYPVAALGPGECRIYRVSSETG
jgi:hypothetical protein